MIIKLATPLSFPDRLRVLWVAWSLGDFRGSLRVLLFGRTGGVQ